MRQQTVFRIDRAARNFTVISNRLLQDPNITHETKGLICELLSRPENWEITVRGIIASGRSGRDKVYRMIKEAEAAGYVSHDQNRNESGTIGKTTYIVSDREPGTVAEQQVSPLPEKPEVADPPLPAQPLPAQPLPANRTQQKKERTKDCQEQHPLQRAGANAGQNAVEEDREGIRGPGFDLPWASVDEYAVLQGYPIGHARVIARCLARSWLTDRPQTPAFATFKRAIREEAASAAPKPKHWRELEREDREETQAALQRVLAKERARNAQALEACA